MPEEAQAPKDGKEELRKVARLLAGIQDLGLALNYRLGDLAESELEDRADSKPKRDFSDSPSEMCERAYLNGFCEQLLRMSDGDTPLDARRAAIATRVIVQLLVDMRDLEYRQLKLSVIISEGIVNLNKSISSLNSAIGKILLAEAGRKAMGT